jgi:hypothetical protein
MVRYVVLLSPAPKGCTVYQVQKGVFGSSRSVVTPSCAALPCFLLRFRWEPWLASQVPRSLRVTTLFLDTTYALPRYTFPPQARCEEQPLSFILPPVPEQPPQYRLTCEGMSWLFEEMMGGPDLAIVLVCFAALHMMCT